MQRSIDKAFRVARPGSACEQAVIAVAQPGFVEAYRAGAKRAHDATVKDGVGNNTHSAVQHWGRLLVMGLKIPMLRPLDSMTTPLARKLAEVDLVEMYAWWLVTQLGTCNTETAWNYVSIVNAWHFRATGTYLAAGMDLQRVKNMLSGLQRLTGQPVPRKRRIGVRAQHLSAGMAATYRQSTDQSISARDANFEAALSSGFCALARACEVASGLPRGEFDPGRHPTRADVQFSCRNGVPVKCAIWIVNSKAKGAEARRKVQVLLPMQRGKHLSPGWKLWELTRIVDKVPEHLAGITPLFRDPTKGHNAPITVKAVREELRLLMRAIGLDGSLYGAHSLRIGGATALAAMGASPEVIKAHGRWRSDAYLRYVRERQAECIQYREGICSFDVDDIEADHLDFEADQLDEDDFE